MMIDYFKGTVRELLMAIGASRLTGIPLWRFSR